MALTITTANIGTSDMNILTKTLTSLETVEQGHAYIKSDIKLKYFMPVVGATGLIQARAATPTSAGTYTQTERTIEPKDIMVYSEINPASYESTWAQFAPQGTMVFQTLPSEVQNSLMDATMKELKKRLNSNLWIGDTAGSDTTGSGLTRFDGFLIIAANDSLTVKVSGTTVTSSNVIAELNKVIAATPNEVIYDPNFKIHLSMTDFRALTVAVQSLANKGASPLEPIERTFSGIKLAPLVAIPSGKMLACVSTAGVDSNLWIGTNNLEDLSTITFDKLQNNSELYFFKALLKVGVGLREPEMVVYYG